MNVHSKFHLSGFITKDNFLLCEYIVKFSLMITKDINLMPLKVANKASQGWHVICNDYLLNIAIGVPTY